MKKFIVSSLLALLSLSSFAKEVAYIPDLEGGRTVFTDDPCLLDKSQPVRGLYQMYNRTAEPSFGCFYVDLQAELLRVIMINGELRVYPLSILVFRPKSRFSVYPN